jgi:hypothetical protein
MKKIVLTLALSFLFCFQAYTQLLCGTEDTTANAVNVPWYGNSAVLYEYLSEYESMIAAPGAIEERTGDKCAEINDFVAIPIQFWLWRENEFDLVPDEVVLSRAINRLNRDYQRNGLKIRFLFCLCACCIFRLLINN